MAWLPWESAENSLLTTQEMLAMVIQFGVGMVIAIVGILVLIGKVPMVGGLPGRLLIGGGVAALGFAIALGYVWSVA